MSLHQTNKEKLLNSVQSKIGYPVNCSVVMATIESMGVRDKDIYTDFGNKNLSDLTTEIFDKLRASVVTTDIDSIRFNNSEKSIPVSGYLRVKAKLFVKYYPLGLLHFLPVLVQLITIVLFGYSLWTYVGFNQLQSTAVVLGVIIGMVITGGFVQVIGRQVSFYWNYKNYSMMDLTINYVLKIGIIAIILIFTVLFIINFFIHLYPYSFLIIVFTYALLIGVLLLILAPMHTIKQRWVVSVAISIGTILALFLKETTTINVYVTHWIGISTSILLSKLYLYFYFKNKVNKNYVLNKSMRVLKLIHHNYAYFFYGILIYLFIFTDRILAWSSSLNSIPPYIIYYEKNYEIGMDIAILIFLLLAGVLEYSVASFSKFLDIGQKNTAYNSPKKFGKHLLKLYWQHVGLLLISSVIIFSLVYYIVMGTWGYEAQFKESLNNLSIRVCIIGSFGYLFLAWGMLNTLYMFTLNQPKKPIKALVIALLINLCVGMVMSRVVAYELSVVGMFLGAITFLVITLKDCVNFYKNLDYYYYATY